MLLALAAAACSGGGGSDPLPSIPEGAAALTVEAPDLTNGQVIRPRYTCDSVNFSPEITWAGVPDDAVTLALIVDDPDAGDGFTHWLVYDLPASVRTLPEAVGAPFSHLRVTGGLQGPTDFGHLGYSGPCPPRGQVHEYEFHVYALDAELGLAPQVKRNTLVEAMAGHVIGHGMLVAPYERVDRFEEGVVFGPTPTPSGS